MVIHEQDFFLQQGPNSDVMYSITGNAAALEYFVINSKTGIITLAKSLVGTSAPSYQVYIYTVHSLVNHSMPFSKIWVKYITI